MIPNCKSFTIPFTRPSGGFFLVVIYSFHPTKEK
ncbi:hypothetical protein VP236O401_P0015 [Vibrio phage 236O40-1]|nr:hypothetical protein VP236O401_P0015 [Vibrio phage 236O40-1]